MDCAGLYVTPGLIDLHSHIGYNSLPLWAEPAQATPLPAPFDIQKAEAEVEDSYVRAHPEIKEYVLWTARTFGPSGMWLNEDALAALPAPAREKRILHLTVLLEEGEYGRHLCAGLAEASALKDKRLSPGLMKVAGYHRADRDYDCRPKWMAVAALARQESDDGRQETRRQGDDSEGPHDEDHGEREKGALGPGEEYLPEEQVRSGDRGREHAVVDLLVFETDEGPVCAFEGRRVHRRGDRQPRTEKLEIGDAVHVRDITDHAQPDPREEDQRLEKGWEAVADQVLRVDPVMPVPDAVEPVPERRTAAVIALH